MEAAEEEDVQELRGVREVLSRPEARAHYKHLGQEHWIQSFIESGDPVHRRLGMKLLLREVVDLVDPTYSRRLGYAEPRTTRDREKTGFASCPAGGADRVSGNLSGTFRIHGAGL